MTERARKILQAATLIANESMEQAVELAIQLEVKGALAVFRKELEEVARRIDFFEGEKTVPSAPEPLDQATAAPKLDFEAGYRAAINDVRKLLGDDRPHLANEVEALLRGRQAKRLVPRNHGGDDGGE